VPPGILPSLVRRGVHITGAARNTPLLGKEGSTYHRRRQEYSLTKEGQGVVRKVNLNFGYYRLL